MLAYILVTISQIRARKFVELDDVRVPIAECPVPADGFKYTSEYSTSQNGYAVQLSIFTATLCNGATVEARYTQYTAVEEISFAGIPVRVRPSSLKLIYTIRNWPFKAENHFLEVKYLPTFFLPLLAFVSDFSYGVCRRSSNW